MKAIGLLAAITLLAATAGKGENPQAPRTADAAEARGRIAFERGDFPSAISLFTDAIRLDPSSADSYLCRGAAYGRFGDYDKAITDYTTAKALDPKNALASYSRAGAYSGKGEHERAIADYTEAVRLDPKYKWAYYNRAHEYESIAQHDKAIADFTEAIRLEPTDVDAYLNRASIFEAKGEHDKAITDCSEVIRLGRKVADAYLNRALSFESKGELHKAIDDCTAAIRVKPDSAEAYRGRGLLYYKKGERGKASADLDDAVRIAPQSPLTRAMRGYVRVRNGNYDGGIDDLRTAIALDPTDPAGKFEAWPKAALTPAAIRFGEEQVRQMLHDRPAMARYGEKTGALYRWAARKFAGEDLKQAIRWEPSEPSVADADCGGAIRPGVMPQIRVRQTHFDGELKGKKISAEELWCRAVYELYNTSITDEAGKLQGQVAAGRLTKKDYVAKMVELESHTMDKTRAFYVNVFLPWAKEHREPTDPKAWYICSRPVPGERSAWMPVDTHGYYPAVYEEGYDFIVLDSLVAKNDAKSALAFAAQLLPRATCDEEKAAIHIDRGYAYLIENDPDKATVELNEALRLEPNDAPAYIGRGRAYLGKSQYDNAIADENTAIRLSAGKDRQNASDAYCVRGWVYGLKGDYGKAIADETESMRLDPENPEPYFRRARIHKQIGDKDKADADTKREGELKQKKLEAGLRESQG